MTPHLASTAASAQLNLTQALPALQSSVPLPYVVLASVLIAAALFGVLLGLYTMSDQLYRNLPNRLPKLLRVAAALTYLTVLLAMLLQTAHWLLMSLVSTTTP